MVRGLGVVESRLYRLLEKRIGEMRNKQLESLGSGQAIDFNAYKDIVGYIRALDDVIAAAAEIDKGIE